jgi:glycosyltransferase involved in cell wall biosynthesis
MIVFGGRLHNFETRPRGGVTVQAFIAKAAVREHLAHDLGPLRELAGRGLYAAASAMRAAGRRAAAYKLLMRTHSGNFSESMDRRIEGELRDATARERRGEPTGLWQSYDEVIAEAAAAFRSGANADPKRLVGSRLLVAKPWRPGERGVLYVDYSYVFASLSGLFDLRAIADRYHLVLEPSWSGVCAPEVLLFSRLDAPVLVETIEPRDRRVLATIATNLEPVAVAANYWVDYRAIEPQPDAKRDIDVIMVAAWAGIKRHWRFFKTLAALRRRGHRLRIALVGYRYDLTIDDIRAQAAHFGIGDQVELFERLSQTEVSALLARSKVHVLWSRRECANRAIIEAMLADVPVIVRSGLTFGFPYPYINAQTGRFVDEAALGDAILEMLERRASYAPRQWVLDHMTCQHATAAVEASVRAAAGRGGEPWTSGLVVKTSTLDTQKYWDPADRDRFAADYQFLEASIR